MKTIRFKRLMTPCKMYPNKMVGSIECKECEYHSKIIYPVVKCKQPSKIEMFICDIFEWHKFIDGKCIRCGKHERV